MDVTERRYWMPNGWFKGSFTGFTVVGNRFVGEDEAEAWHLRFASQ